MTDIREDVRKTAVDLFFAMTGENCNSLECGKHQDAISCVERALLAERERAIRECADIADTVLHKHIVYGTSYEAAEVIRNKILSLLTTPEKP